MSVFGKIFGSSRKQQAPSATPQESIQKLRETEEMLVKKQEFLEKKIEAVGLPTNLGVLVSFFHEKFSMKCVNTVTRNAVGECLILLVLLKR